MLCFVLVGAERDIYMTEVVTSLCLSVRSTYVREAEKRNRRITVRAGTPTYTLHLWTDESGKTPPMFGCWWEWTSVGRCNGNVTNCSSQRITKWVTEWWVEKQTVEISWSGSRASQRRLDQPRAVLKHCYRLILSNAFQLQHSRMGNWFKWHISF